MQAVPLTSKHTNDISLPDIDDSIVAIRTDDDQDGWSISFILSGTKPHSPMHPSVSPLNFVTQVSDVSAPATMVI